MMNTDYGDILKLVDVPREYRPTHATNILIHFSKPKKTQKSVVDLGCGVGISSLMISKKYGVQVLGVDSDGYAINIGRVLIEKLGLDERVQLLNIDVDEIKIQRDLREKFDLVVSNPPHHFEGKLSPNPVREKARRTSIEQLESFIRAAFHLLKNGGEFLFVLSPERLPDVLNSMRKFKMEPKIMVPIYGRYGKDCELVVLKGRKNGKPGFKIEKPVFLSGDGI